MRAILQELTYDAPIGGAVWPFDRHYIRPPHFHGQLELLLATRGSATLQVGAHAARLGAGQLCWIWPCLPHVMSAFSDDFDMWVIQLAPDLVARSWRRAAGRSDGARRAGCDLAEEVPFDCVFALARSLGGRPIVDLPPAGARALGESARTIWSAGSAAGLRARLQALSDLALDATLGRPRAGPDTSIAELASCILLGAPLMERQELADTLGVSEGFMSRRFGRDLGVSFVEHRARARVAHFLELAGGHRRGFLDAALAAGFGSYSQFHRVFTRIAGGRPTDYFSGCRRQRELLVAADGDRPQTAAVLSLPIVERQRTPVSA